MNVQSCEKNDVLDILINGGSQRYVEKGTIKLLPIIVHMYKHSLETVLSFKDVVW